MSKFRKHLFEQAKENVARNLANHQIRQRHRDGDIVRLWRCDNGGSSVYHFTVCAPPGWLIVYGDMGECMWSRSPDMLKFIRGSIESFDYFAEKVAKECKIKERRSELLVEFLDEFEGQYALNHGEVMSSEQRNELSDLRGGFDEGNIEQFMLDWSSSSFCVDCDSYPDVECYTFCYIWKVEALKWFIAKLDAGEFILDPYDWSANS